MRKNIEKTEIYCQSLSSENDNKLQLSRFFDNSAQNFSCHAPRYPRKTALEQKLFASVSEVENVLVCLGQDREGCGGNILSVLQRIFSSGPGEPLCWQIPKISTLAGAAAAEDGGGTAAKAAIPDTGAKNSGWTRGDILLPLEKLARGLLVIKAFHR